MTYADPFRSFAASERLTVAVAVALTLSPVALLFWGWVTRRLDGSRFR